jgi:hypothetical protein
MADDIAPEFVRFIKEERQARRLPVVQGRLKEGEVLRPITVNSARATEFLRVAARRAAGFILPSKHTEIVWVRGDSELAVSLVALTVKLSDGLIRVLMPVRCDQTGRAIIEIAFVVGTPTKPAGLYAATYRRPNGPPLIVNAWGEALIAFAWQCVLGMITGIAGASGKDARGNVLVPVEVTASAKGLQIVPMARHRFSSLNPHFPVSTVRGGQ